MKSLFVTLLLLFAFVHCQSPDEIPEELKCFLRGFFKCRSGLRTVCSNFKGNNRRPVPIPKRRFDGQCPILGQEIPKVDLKAIDLPPCPCTNGTSVSSTQLYMTIQAACRDLQVAPECFGLLQSDPGCPWGCKMFQNTPECPPAKCFKFQ